MITSRVIVGSVRESKVAANMRFVKIEQTDTGYLLNPNAYLDWLEESAASLPAGSTGVRIRSRAL